MAIPVEEGAFPRNWRQGPPDGREARDDRPAHIARPAMRHRWERLSFVHWPFPREAVGRLLPPGLEPHLFAGAAWVGLIPFRLRVRVPASAPALPWLSSFAEVNVRTYVRGPDGRTGIWFFSLEAARLLPVLTARAWYHLPYNWARTSLRRAGGAVIYESRRRWPGPRGAGLVAVVKPESRIGEDATALERFLTCRFGLWTPSHSGLAYTSVAHPQWPLRRARLLYLADDLVETAGLPRPGTPPLVHYSEAVDVRFGGRVAVPF